MLFETRKMDYVVALSRVVVAGMWMLCDGRVNGGIADRAVAYRGRELNKDMGTAAPGRRRDFLLADGPGHAVGAGAGLDAGFHG
jgi:hypothetical protein